MKKPHELIGRLWAIPLALMLCLTMLLAAGVPIASAEEATGDGNEQQTSEGSTQRQDPDADLEALFSGDLPADRLEQLLQEMSKDGAIPEATIENSEEIDDSRIEEVDEGDQKPVGRLKLFARYNDKMAFYDGHVCLVFTSYQDGTTIEVPDLYAAYDISDQYYADIAEDILNGSNHTGTDTSKYFTPAEGTQSVTLNRGEVVSIGMYRGFDLSIPQTLLGAIEDSTLWHQLSNEAKSEIVDVLFHFFKDLDTEPDAAKNALDRIKLILAIYGFDYHNLIDGTVEGGVCFNRELYNQKLQYDQFENVTYELDITSEQLSTLARSLEGNRDKFNILTNSCATVALRAWNNAVADNDPENEYYVTAEGSGIYAIADTPKGVRDNMRDKFEGLPDYHLNNSDSEVEDIDPEQGGWDDTGWVYVTAPKPVNPVRYTYEDDSVVIDETKTNMGSLINAARAGAQVPYDKDDQEIKVTVNRTVEGDATTITSIDFDINGTPVSLSESTALEQGMWLKVQVDEPQQGEEYYVTDADGNALASTYEDGQLVFLADALPTTYQVNESANGTRNILKTTIVNAEEASVTTDVYTKEANGAVILDPVCELASGTKIYVKSTFEWSEITHLLRDITLNGTSILDDEHWDDEELAYVVEMPASYADLQVVYDTATLTSLGHDEAMLQVSVGDVLDVADYVQLTVGTDKEISDRISWSLVASPDEALEVDETGKLLEAKSAGSGMVWAYADDNINMGHLFIIEVYEDYDELAMVVYPEDKLEVFIAQEGEIEKPIPYSGYLVEKGTELIVNPMPENGTVLSGLTANLQKIDPGEPITVDDDVIILASYEEAKIVNMPETLSFASKGESFQLDAKVKYAGLISQLLPVYDPSIRYVSSSDEVTVDENGLITVTGEVPDEGKVVIVTAYAGSSNDSVSAQTKVILGDYRGTDIVGRLTIYARTINAGQFVAHSAVTFTTYDDIDLNASYYHWYEPTDQYKSLMQDYRDNPDAYNGLDPALYNDNALGIEDRGSYFIEHDNGAGSEPALIHLRCGESISMSNYSYDANNLYTIFGTLQNATISDSASAKTLVEQARIYQSLGFLPDGPEAYDSLLDVVCEMIQIERETGNNPADGHTIGGTDINREMYNDFRRDDSQMPNTFYTVEITADELAQLEAYLADPNNNYYSFFVKNCGTGAMDIWNAALSDRPELILESDLFGIAKNPQSLYFELAMLRVKTLKTYKPGVQEEGGGVNFYPRTVACYEEPEGLELDYSGAPQELVIPGNAGATGYDMLYSLDGETYSADVPTGTDPGAYVIYFKLGKVLESGEVEDDPKHNHAQVKMVNSSIGDITGVEVYRMYNSLTSEHLYTSSKDEFDSCGQGAYKDWVGEGVCWIAPAEGAKGAQPVYRLYNAGLGDHHFTSDQKEADALVEKHGWNNEGIAFYSGGEIPIYRLYNSGLLHGQHHLTVDHNEVDALVARFGWIDEGEAMRCLSLPKPEES